MTQNGPYSPYNTFLYDEGGLLIADNLNFLTSNIDVPLLGQFFIEAVAFASEMDNNPTGLYGEVTNRTVLLSEMDNGPVITGNTFLTPINAGAGLMSNAPVVLTTFFP